jgi:hypothetical protein
MKTQHVSIASAAAVLVVSMAAFAQSPQPASPSSQGAQQSTTQAKPESSVTLVGCVMRESEYRQATDAGKGGPANTGFGRSEEFVLIHAKKATGAGSAAAPATCSAAAGTGEAYELVGSREKDLEQYVNKAVEIRGTVKAADPFAAQQKPTVVSDPLKQGLKLVLVDVASFRALPAGQSAAAAAPAAQPPAAAPQPAPAPPPSEQSAAAAPRQNLPRTASPLPLAGLLGLLSLAAGLALRRRA